MKTAYDDFETLILSLKQQGLAEPANALHELLHETAWTTSSELLGELGIKIREIKKRYKNELTPQTNEVLRVCQKNLPQSPFQRILGLFGQ